MKKCSKCKVIKPFESFYKNKYKLDGLNIWCNACFNSSRKIYRDNNLSMIRRINLRKRYNITIDEYEKILLSQNGVCAICRKNNLIKRRFAVDHNHKTNKIRGILCYKCNVGLGSFEDDTTLLQKAILYLKEN